MSDFSIQGTRGVDKQAPLLLLDDVNLSIAASGESSPILRGLTLSLERGERLGVVGESGSGKSMTLRVIMNQLPEGASMQGQVTYNGENVSEMRGSRLREFRSRQVAVIYQDPRAHINPVWTVGHFITEAVLANGLMSREEAQAKALALLSEVGIRDGMRRMSQYPSQLSGGLLQRVMIVAALMPGPSLILADEPTTALDVTVQKDVMRALIRMCRDHGVSLIFVTHDLDLAAVTTDKIAVMYAGRIMEVGNSEDVVSKPEHPYTAALLRSRPKMHVTERPMSIRGFPQSARNAPGGCPFSPRCEYSIDKCQKVLPILAHASNNVVACHRASELHGKLV